MEKTPQNNQTTEKIPHSYPHEQPEVEFDNTTLEEAVEQGFITTPDSVQDLTRTEVLPVTERKKSKKGILIGASAGLAGLAIAGGAIFGVSTANSNTAEPEAPATPVEVVDEDTPSTPEEAVDSFEVFGLPTVEELEISADQGDEAIAEQLIKLDSDTIMSGANQEMKDQRTEGDNGYLSLDDYADKIASISIPVYSEALYGDKLDQPEIAAEIADNKIRNRTGLVAHFSSYGAQNEEQYKRTTEFVSLDAIEEVDESSKKYSVTVIQKDNANKTAVVEPGEPEIIFTTTLETYVDANGNVKLSAPIKYSR